MSDKLKIMVLSGVREQGKNMFAVQVNDEIFVLDAGLKYPDSSLFGIDVVIPDMEFFKQYGDQVAGIFLTHGHADSIGALPYILRDWDIPVFGSKLTIELAKIDVERENKRRNNQLFNVIDADTEIDFKNASVSFFHTTHSVPDSLGIVIHAPQGQIVYTGDFKFDPSARPAYRTDMTRLAEIAKNGVLALLPDSSNAEAVLPNASENEVGNYITNVFRNAKGRIIVAGKASNINRVQQVFNAAAATGRRVLLTGRDVAKIVHTAMKMGYLEVPDGLLMKAKELKDVPAFRRFGGQTAYIEGWGLYAESLGKELGVYADPYQRFGQLSAEIWRAIRLVVDTGLHSKGWTREQVLEYMHDNSGLSETDAIAEAERYMAIPGQALAYKIGQLKITELRNKAQQELGDKFDIREFHAQVLGDGSLPLAVLETKIDRWIATKKAAG